MTAPILGVTLGIWKQQRSARCVCGSVEEEEAMSTQRTREPVEQRVAPQPTGWVGWVIFGGVMMVLIGIFELIAGLTALFNDQYFLVNSNGLLVSLDFTSWGWIHLILGIVVALAGFSLISGATWARVVAIILASLSAIANLLFIAAY